MGDPSNRWNWSVVVRSASSGWSGTPLALQHLHMSVLIVRVYLLAGVRPEAAGERGGRRADQDLRGAAQRAAGIHLRLACGVVHQPVQGPGRQPEAAPAQPGMPLPWPQPAGRQESSQLNFSVNAGRSGYLAQLHADGQDLCRILKSSAFKRVSEEGCLFWLAKTGGDLGCWQ